MELTNRQREVLEYIQKYYKDHNYSPTIRDICKGLGLSSPATVHSHISKLINKGYLKKEKGFRTYVINKTLEEKNARELFESLGFRYLPCIEYISYRNIKTDEIIRIDRTTLEVVFTMKYKRDNWQSEYIMIYFDDLLLQAINKQIEELRWNK